MARPTISGNPASSILDKLPGGPAEHAMRLGVPKTTISTWRKRGYIPPEYWRVLSTALGIHISEFCKWEEKRAGIDYEQVLATVLAGRTE